MQQANLIEVRRWVWVCPSCRYENVLDGLDKCVDPKQAEWCGHCGEVSQTQREQVMSENAELAYEHNVRLKEEITELTTERDELLSLLVQVKNAARLKRTDHYTDMRIDNDILKALAKYKRGE